VHSTTAENPPSSNGYPHRRDADDFRAEMQARKALADELHGATHVDEAQILELARAAADRLVAGATWNDWVTVGRALQIGRTEALREAHTNKPEGRGYAAAFSRWLTTAKLDKAADKPTRARLLDLLDHLQEVEKWRAILTVNRRLELNHPRTVWQQWQKSKIVPDPDKPRPPSPVARLKQSVADLEQENHRLKEAGGNLFTSKDSARDVVGVLRSMFSESKLGEIRALLGKAG
jgi:hypothetical protein